MRKSRSGIKSNLKKLDATEPTAADYDEAPELTDEQLAVAVVSNGVNLRGRPKAEVTKVPVSLRLDADVVRAYRSTGPGWQTLMNMTLRSKLKDLRQPIAKPTKTKKLA